MKDFKSANHEAFAALSDREKQIVDLIVAGAISREIASAVGLSKRTVEVHRRNIAQRLGTPRVADLVRLAAEAYYRGKREL